MTMSECYRRLGLSAKQLSLWRAELRAAEPKELVRVKVSVRWSAQRSAS
jgi:hypothetical protein